MLAPLVFDSSLLTTTLEAVQRRSKAIRYHGLLECSRELDRGFERLNIDIRSTDQLLTRFSLWSDGVFLLSVHKAGSRREGGWQLAEQVEGTLGEWTPFDVVERIEATIMSPTDVSRIWRPNASNPALQRTAPRSDA